MNKAQRAKLFHAIQCGITSNMSHAYRNYVESLPFEGAEVIKWEDMKRIVENIAADVQTNIFQS